MARVQIKRIRAVTTCRLWDRLDIDSQSNLRYAQWVNYRQKLAVPGQPITLVDFDPDREMRRTPHPEGSQWRK